MLVWCDLHVARNVLCTAISRAVVINTRDFTKKLGTSQKNTRVLHSRVSSLNRAVPYVSLQFYACSSRNTILYTWYPHTIESTLNECAIFKPARTVICHPHPQVVPRHNWSPWTNYGRRGWSALPQVVPHEFCYKYRLVQV